MHLIGGVSRATTTKILKFIEIIINTSFHTNQELESQSTIPISYDVHTAMSSLSIEPQIIWNICYPKCFHHYPLNSLSETYSWRESPQSKRCGEKLWTRHSTQSSLKVVPYQLYTTEDFKSWLEFFLSHLGIEDLIDLFYQHCSPETIVMNDIWDSPAWRSIGLFTTTAENLTFSFFIDWFNPFMNKTAEKMVSCGVIMIFCLNLPYHLHHKSQNTFFAGITPLSYEPWVTTITALLDPIIDQLCHFHYGVIVHTHCYPEDIMKCIGILVLIGNLPAICKALGFAGIASLYHFCSFCSLGRLDIESLDIDL